MRQLSLCLSLPKATQASPVFEPIANDTCDRDSLPSIKYPSRRSRHSVDERRAIQAQCRLTADYDFAVWFDQFEIPEHLRNHFCFRVGDQVFHLKGARWAGVLHDPPPSLIIIGTCGCWESTKSRSSCHQRSRGGCLQEDSHQTRPSVPLEGQSAARRVAAILIDQPAAPRHFSWPRPTRHISGCRGCGVATPGPVLRSRCTTGGMWRRGRGRPEPWRSCNNASTPAQADLRGSSTIANRSGGSSTVHPTTTLFYTAMIAQ